MTMPGHRAWGAVAAVAALICGCDAGGTGKAPGGPPPAPAPSETITVAVILPGRGLAESDVWEAEARRDEARAHALIEIRKPGPDDPPSRQADLIREAVAGGASALIVVADDPDAVSGALKEAIEGGMPVVILDRPVPLPGVVPPPPLVAPESEFASAQGLVEAAIADAQAAGFAPGGPALILRNGPDDPHSKARVAAIRDALEARGVRVLPEVRFSGLRETARGAAAVAYLASGGASMVFADEEEGLRGVAQFRHGLPFKSRRFVLAGYTADPQTLDFVKYNTCAAIVDRKIRDVMPVAIDAAMALIRGQTVASEIRVRTPLNRASGPEVEGQAPPILQHASQMEQKMKSDKEEEDSGTAPRRR